MIVKILNNPALRSDGITGKRFLLVDPMTCVVDGQIITVPEGFDTDFASIPAFAWPVAEKLGRYNRAAILHDYLYKDGRFSRKMADQVFLAGMKYLGVPAWRRRLMYWAVRAAGWHSWDGYRGARSV
jgi:hypothetical protein